MKNTLPLMDFKSKLWFIILAVLTASAVIFLSKTPEPSPEIPESGVYFPENSADKTQMYTKFNPNDLNAEQWQLLGFSEKQTATILKYKNMVGGTFISKEQFKKCYAVSDEKYAELESYILLPETASGRSYTQNRPFYSSAPAKSKININEKFNPDHYSQQQWENLGFSEKQAAAILKYKNYLGGSFMSKEKFRECFVIGEEQYKALAPYLLLPEHQPENATEKTRIIKTESTKSYSNFDPNELDAEGWKALGFSEKQAAVIINYKNRNLKGKFSTLEEIQKCFVISPEKFEELKPFIVLNTESPSTTAVATPKISPKESVTNFSKTDINELTYQQLLEFGFDGKAAGSFIGFRKKLGGFVDKNQVFEVFDIDRSLAEKLVSISQLNPSPVEKHTLTDAPESWLKTHPYFRYSADKIIYYRISNPDEKKIWKFIKTKPEYERKMRMYLRD